MRLTRSFLLLFATIASCVAMLLLATSCANSKRSSIRYSAPSTAPVQEKISDATTAVGDVSAAIAEAKAINTDERVGHALTIAETRANDAKAALAIAGDKTLLLDSAVRNQTDILNRTIGEKNDAITRADVATGKYHKLKFWACLLGAAAVFFLFSRFKGPIVKLLAFYPPAAAAITIITFATPAVVFGVLWLIL